MARAKMEPSAGPRVTTTFEMPKQEMAADAQPAKEAVSFWEHIGRITDKEWKEHYTLWIYRIGPKVPMLPGVKGYLATLSEPVSPMYIQQRWGGGTFRLILNRDSRMEATHEEDISGEPKFDLTKEAPPAQSQRGGGDPAVTQLLDRLPDSKEVLKDSMEMVTTAYKQSLSNIAESAAKITGNSGESETTKLLIAMMQSQTQMLMSMMTLVMKQAENKPAPAPAPAASELEMLDRVTSVFSKLREVSGEFTSTRRGSVVETLVEKLVDKGPDLAKEIRSGITAVGAQRIALEREKQRTVEMARGAMNPAMAPATGAIPFVAPRAVPSPVPPAGGGPLRTVPMGTAEEVSAAEAEGVPVISPEDAFKVLGYKRAVQLIFEGENGATIMEFLYGLDRKAHDFICGLDAEGIKAVLSSEPNLAQALQYPNIDDTISQIIEYAGEIAEPDKAVMPAGPN